MCVKFGRALLPFRRFSSLLSEAYQQCRNFAPAKALCELLYAALQKKSLQFPLAEHKGTLKII